jgi:outer membrane phospholipase A
MGILSDMFAEEKKQSAFSIYKDNYFITGNKNDQTKFQVSIKYALIYPFDIGFYVAYTQTSYWATYERSSPFKETNYNPEIFWRLGNNNDHIQLGFLEHRSNGKNGDDSRGWNRSYLQFNLSTNTLHQIGINMKFFYLYNVSGKNSYNKEKDRPDISEFDSWMNATLYYRIRNDIDLEIFRVYATGGFGGSKKFTYHGHRRFGFNGKGWIQAGANIKIPWTQLYLYGYVWYGYGEFLHWYYKKTFCVRGGFGFRW